MKGIKPAILFLGAAFSLAGCKQSVPIQVDAARGNVVFKLPRLPRLGPLYVEKLNKDKDAFEVVWEVNFDTEPVDGGLMRAVEYGKPPAGVSMKGVPEPEPLEPDVLYNVSMDVGSVVAKARFVIEKKGGGITVRNLTPEEAEAFRNSNR